MNRKEKYKNSIDSRFLNGIAHRGFHNEIVPENSLEAFKKAIENDLAFEFDVQLSKDNELVVCHDFDLKRMCQKEGLIRGLTLQEIKRDYRLPNGESVPSIQDVLSLNSGQTPMVIEIKVPKHVPYKTISKKVIEVLSPYKEKKKIILISFDPRVLLLTKKLMFKQQFLICEEYKNMMMFLNLFDSVDVEYSLLKQPKIKRYGKKHFVNVWTIDDDDKLDNCPSFVDTVTFQSINKENVLAKLKQNK